MNRSSTGTLLFSFANFTFLGQKEKFFAQPQRTIKRLRFADSRSRSSCSVNLTSVDCPSYLFDRVSPSTSSRLNLSSAFSRLIWDKLMAYPQYLLYCCLDSSVTPSLQLPKYPIAQTRPMNRPDSSDFGS